MTSDPEIVREPAPDWRTLLVIGLDRLRDARTYGWFFASSIALSLAGSLAPEQGVGEGLALIVTLVATTYTYILLSRHLMTGVLRAMPYDGIGLVRLIGAWFILVFIVAIPGLTRIIVLLSLPGL